MTHSLTIRPAFTPLTILLMVLGFIFFWPLGLVMLAYMLWGHRFHELGGRMEGYRQGWSREFACGRHRSTSSRGFSSGNLAFDEYRDRELQRLEEERRRLDAERREFEGFMRNLRRAKDQEEFDRFMRDRPAARPDEATEI
jgi:Protein of unknown function (DUF2852)